MKVYFNHHSIGVQIMMEVVMIGDTIPTHLNTQILIMDI
jgi:hypothetical protein